MKKEGRIKEASKIIQTTKQSNTAHPRQSHVHHFPCVQVPFQAEYGVWRGDQEEAGDLLWAWPTAQESAHEYAYG